MSPTSKLSQLQRRILLALYQTTQEDGLDPTSLMSYHHFRERLYGDYLTRSEQAVLSRALVRLERRGFLARETWAIHGIRLTPDGVEVVKRLTGVSRLEKNDTPDACVPEQ